MAKKKVLIDVPPIHADGLKAFENVPDVELIRYFRDGDQPLLDAVKDVAGIMVGLSEFDEAVIKNAPGLEIIAKHGVGYDNIDILLLDQFQAAGSTFGHVHAMPHVVQKITDRLEDTRFVVDEQNIQS